MENKANVKLLSLAGQGGSAFGITLLELMKERDDIMVLSADMSTPAGLDKFKSTYPHHFMNVGIAEQNMIGIAAGLAEEGFKVICVAQACFLTMRCYEQIRQFAGYMGIPMILVGIGSGLSLQYMGNTHYALEDIALMRTIPEMNIMVPCDALEASKVFENATKNNKATYIRLYGGTGIPVVHLNDFGFESDKTITLREGKDVTILATGSMVKQALLAADMLTQHNIDAEVIDVFSIQPFNGEILEKSTGKKLVATIEEHRLIGGLGCVVSEYITNNHLRTKLLKIGIADIYPLPGSYPYMLEQCGLTAEQITNNILKNI